VGKGLNAIKQGMLEAQVMGGVCRHGILRFGESRHSDERDWIITAPVNAERHPSISIKAHLLKIQGREAGVLRRNDVGCRWESKVTSSA